MPDAELTIDNEKRATDHWPLTTDRCLFIVPGKIDRLTGGSIYDKRLAGYLIERGARVDVASLPDLPYFAGLLASPIVALWLIIKLVSRRYDFVIEDGWAHPSLVVFNLFCRLASRLKLIVIVHQLRSLERTGAVAATIERAALHSSHLIITVSHFMRREIARLVDRSPRIIIASPGCGARRESPETSCDEKGESDNIRLLFVGNLMRRKGLNHLIRALAIANDSGIALDIVGDQSFEPRYYDELRGEVERLGLKGAVKFHGRVSDEALRRFYARADIFVMPSLYEGYGMVYAEAMSAGLPVIALDAGPVPEIARAGENALLVPPAPEERLPHALAEAIRELAANAGLRAEMSRRSLELAAQLPRWKDTCETIYENLLSLNEPDSKNH